MFWRLSDAAERDLVEITDYIARQDPRAAARILDLCLERFDMFVRQPLIGESCDIWQHDSDGSPPGTTSSSIVSLKTQGSSRSSECFTGRATSMR